VTLDEARAGVIARARPVRVALGDAPGTPWIDATIAEIARLDPASHTFLVKIDLPATADRPSGSFGRARFAGPPQRGLAVPRSAIVRRGQLAFVYVATASGRARLQPIAPGHEDGDRVEVLAGLGAGDRIVVEPPPALADGAPIREGTR
jgi:multidrug efflux pump subunit AcrA (membrane-fusion protein)